MASGRVLQFDHSRGYGFVTAEDGGEDIFLHASVFDGDPDLLAPGRLVEFQLMSGDRGRKAFGAHLVEDKFHTNGQTLSFAPVAAIPAQSADEADEIVAPLAEEVAGQGDPTGEPDEEQLCDVLSRDEFTHALTELLLGAAPGLTGQQVLDVRQCLLEFAQQHGWADG